MATRGRVELHRERVVLRRAVRGMRMAINVRVSDFLGVALRAQSTTRRRLIARASRPVAVGSAAASVLTATRRRPTLAIWSDMLRAAAELDEGTREPAPRRRRRNAIHAAAACDS